MDRYTERTKYGHAVIHGDSVYSDCGVPEGFRGCAIDRLAAYEDTGLEPEEIEGIKALAVLGLTCAAETGGGEMDKQFFPYPIDPYCIAKKLATYDPEEEAKKENMMKNCCYIEYEQDMGAHIPFCNLDGQMCNMQCLKAGGD